MTTLGEMQRECSSVLFITLDSPKKSISTTIGGPPLTFCFRRSWSIDDSNYFPRYKLWLRLKGCSHSTSQRLMMISRVETVVAPRHSIGYLHQMLCSTRVRGCVDAKRNSATPEANRLHKSNPLVSVFQRVGDRRGYKGVSLTVLLLPASREVYPWTFPQ